MVVPFVLTTSDFRYSNQVIATGKLTGSYQIHLDSWYILLGYGEIMMGILGRELWADLLPEQTSIRGEVYSFLFWLQFNCLYTHMPAICVSLGIVGIAWFSFCTIWVTGTKIKSSGLQTSALTYYTISPAPFRIPT